MTFPTFPEITGFPSIDPDLYWGYACAGHVGLREFKERCREKYAPAQRCPTFTCDGTFPGHAFVRWEGFGGWTFCFPDERGAKPITFWHADGCSYDEWLMQMLKDICHRPARVGDDERALRIIHLLQQFRYSGYGPAIDAYLATTAKESV